MLAFAFLVTLFVGPVQIGTQVLTDAQNAIAGWRRVIGILDTPADVVDPGAAGDAAAARADDGRSSTHVAFAYPGGPPVLHDIDLDIEPGTRVAVVGETGSGKTTFAKLLTRLMDPTSGAVRLDGVDLREVPFASLRERVVLVPQEGFLFDATRRGQRRATAGLDATDDERPPRRRRARAGRLAGRAAARPATPGSASAASRCRPGSGSWSRCPGPPRRPRPAGPRRGHQRRGPGPGDAHRRGPSSG